KGECTRHNRTLRHRAVGWTRPAEEDPLPVVQMPDSVRAANARECTAACVMRSTCQLFVDWLQRCGMNMYNHFTVFVSNDRLWEFFVSRHGSNRVQNGCMHAGFPLANRLYSQMACRPPNVNRDKLSGSNQSRRPGLMRRTHVREFAQQIAVRPCFISLHFT